MSSGYFGPYTSFWLEVEVVLEGIAIVCFVEFCMARVGETTSFPLCSTCLICFVLFIFALGEMNG